MSELFIGGKGNKKGDAPKIEFPCRYPVKVLGVASEELNEQSRRVIARHAPSLVDGDIKTKESREGKFRSITFTIDATGEKQLSAIFEELMQLESVKMVL